MATRAAVPVLAFGCLVLGASSMSCGPSTDLPDPPVAEPRPHVIETHGERRVDPYYWLRDREDPEVLAYLEAENDYTGERLRHTEDLQRTLFEEIVGRIAEDDATVPAKKGPHWYYVRFSEGQEYPVYCRRDGAEDGPERVLLDVNELARDKDFFSVRGFTVGPGHRVAAYATDDVGRRRYTLRFRDLDAGRDLPDAIEDVDPGFAWARDERTVFYARKDPETLRAFQVWRHVLGTDPAADVLVFQEDDETFSVGVTAFKSGDWIGIVSSQTLSTEWQVLSTDDPGGEFRVVEPRRRDHEYDLDHMGDAFFIRTNLDAKNFRLVQAPVDRPGVEHWTEVLPHRDDVLLEGIELFRDFLVVAERDDGLIRLRVRPWDGTDEHRVEFDEPAYVAYPMSNHELDTSVLRFGYQSLTTPDSVFDYDLTTRERRLRKRERVLGDFDRGDYVSERLHATARDGAQVPISLVRRKDVAADGTAPLLLYGYGSYGSTLEPTFSSARLSLLDRGFVFAIAHVRGGSALGREWYEAGKLDRKLNTFLDFIDCALYLRDEGHADPERLYAMGGSAGGLLMGAVMNLRPDLWGGIVARVPFVDVVTTMLDDSIPLTTFEYDEWGNPAEPDDYRVMLEYSPYDNVEPKAYPPALVTTGLHDSQVQYWEPAKWVAKLRANKTDDAPLLLRTDMEAGHGGASGRFRSQRETAMIYAFLLDLAGEG